MFAAQFFRGCHKMNTTFARTNSRRRFVANILSLLGCAMLTVNVLGQGESGSEKDGNASKPLHLLFVGNSYTYVNMLPEMLRQMSLAAKEGRPIEYRMIAPGGYSFEKHWKDGVVAKAIGEGGWDYVVFQEQSLGPVSDPTNMHRYARLLNEEVRKVGAKTAFYVTWARKTVPGQQEQITGAYSAIAKELGALSCPVGPAWAEVLKKRPALELYQADGSHPSPAGTYIGACVFYSVLCFKNPVGLPGRLVGKNDRGEVKTLVDLNESEASLFQHVAFATVKEWNDGATPPETVAAPK